MSAAVRRRSLLAVLSSTGGLGLAYGIGYTLTSLRFEAWGQPGWLVGLAGAAPALAVLLLVPFGPAVAARLGAAPAMLAGAALLAATFALMPVLDSPQWWLVLRVLSGAGLALPWLVGETWINTVSDDRWRGRVLAAYTVLLFGGWALGAQLVGRLGVDGWSAYAAGVAAMALCALPLVLGRRLAPALHRGGRFRLRSAIGLAPVAMAAALIGGVAEFGYISLVPSYALATGLAEARAVHVLTALILGGVVLQAVVGLLADRLDRVRLLAGLGVALSMGVLGLAVTAGSFPASLVAAFLLGGVATGFYSVGLAVLGSGVPVASLAAANAAYLMSYEAGAVVGPLVGGAALDAWRPHGLAVVMAAAGLAFAAVMVGARRRDVSSTSAAGPSASDDLIGSAADSRPGDAEAELVEAAVRPGGRVVGPPR
ncbi:MAG: MFS transporter [Kineosporiaceae bacterium]